MKMRIARGTIVFLRPAGVAVALACYSWIFIHFVLIDPQEPIDPATAGDQCPICLALSQIIPADAPPSIVMPDYSPFVSPAPAQEAPARPALVCQQSPRPPPIAV
jgi:hypothetical protein